MHDDPAIHAVCFQRAGENDQSYPSQNQGFNQNNGWEGGGGRVGLALQTGKPQNANRIQNRAFGILSRPHGVSKLNETPPENTG